MFSSFMWEINLNDKGLELFEFEMIFFLCICFLNPWKFISPLKRIFKFAIYISSVSLKEVNSFDRFIRFFYIRKYRCVEYNCFLWDQDDEVLTTTFSFLSISGGSCGEATVAVPHTT